jgi:hypothetical protein
MCFGGFLLIIPPKLNTTIFFLFRKPSWSVLAQRLTRLELTCPASYSPNSYSLPLADYLLLVAHLAGLTSLRLVGVGREGPLPLTTTLRYFYL